MGHGQGFTAPRSDMGGSGAILAMAASDGGGQPMPDRTDPVPSQAMSPLVVVVDDDASIVEGLSILLESWGYRVLRSLALDDLSKRLTGSTGQPGLVIADHFLPAGGTGLQAVEMVRRHAGTEVPAIILTGDTTPDRRNEAEAMRCRLLHKPVQVAPLREAVESLIRR